MRAAALRKFGRFEEALRIASGVVREIEGGSAQGPAGLEAHVSALCCRGYCYLEKARGGEDTLDRAIEALERAAGIAVEAGIPVQPRIFTGLGHVYRLLGREQEADRAIARALRIDGDNRKAREAAGGG